MGRMRILVILVVIASCLHNTLSVQAKGPLLSDLSGPIRNKHNLSSRNTGVAFHAVDNPNDPRSNQICIFCHIPHSSSSQMSLWNRRDPTRYFGHYSSATLVVDDPSVRAKSQYGEPTGSARLCLSCHDGQTALGAVLYGPPIQFVAGQDKIAFFNISGHHPVSFVYNTEVLANIQIRKPLESYQLPPVNSFVKLDKRKRMQCTACHDPHQDQSEIPSSLTPFWVGPSYDNVCKECHNIDPLPPSP